MTGEGANFNFRNKRQLQEGWHSFGPSLFCILILKLSTALCFCVEVIMTDSTEVVSICLLSLFSKVTKIVLNGLVLQTRDYEEDRPLRTCGTLGI
jgi:hypothetical protein